MKINWKRIAGAFIVTAAVLMTARPMAILASENPIVSAKEPSYWLTDSITAQVKSVVYEQSGDGSRIGAVIRLSNHGDRNVRCPDYELRMQTNDGAEYPLSGSAANASTIQPKETAELGYMVQMGASETISIASLVWVELDEYARPKQETVKLSIPVASIVWQGDNYASGGDIAVKEWGDSFVAPQISGPFVYKGVRVTEQYADEGFVTVITLAVSNPGTLIRKVPEFRFDGRGKLKLYRGARIGKETITLGPGETGYVHFAIPSDPEDRLKGLILQTEEAFVGPNQNKTAYSVGWLELSLPETKDAKAYISGLEPQTFHNPIHFNPLNKLVPKGMDVSLEQLHLLESSEDGDKVVNAKLKITNNRGFPVPLPQFQADLLTADGNVYPGIRLESLLRMLPPRLSYMVEYTFILPEVDGTEDLAIRLKDSHTLESYSIPIADFRAKVLNESGDTDVSIYPYRLQFKEWSVKTTSVLEGGQYVYSQKVKLKLKAERLDKVLFDPNQGKIRVELAKTDGTRLGSQMLSLKLDQWPVSGEQTLLFADTGEPGFRRDFVLNIYETVTTTFGVAERLVKTLKE